MVDLKKDYHFCKYSVSVLLYFPLLKLSSLSALLWPSPLSLRECPEGHGLGENTLNTKLLPFHCVCLLYYLDTVGTSPNLAPPKELQEFLVSTEVKEYVYDKAAEDKRHLDIRRLWVD